MRKPIDFFVCSLRFNISTASMARATKKRSQTGGCGVAQTFLIEYSSISVLLLDNSVLVDFQVSPKTFDRDEGTMK